MEKEGNIIGDKVRKQELEKLPILGAVDKYIQTYQALFLLIMKEDPILKQNGIFDKTLRQELSELVFYNYTDLLIQLLEDNAIHNTPYYNEILKNRVLSKFDAEIDYFTNEEYISCIRRCYDIPLYLNKELLDSETNTTHSFLKINYLIQYFGVKDTDIKTLGMFYEGLISELKSNREKIGSIFSSIGNPLCKHYSKPEIDSLKLNCDPDYSAIEGMYSPCRIGTEDKVVKLLNEIAESFAVMGEKRITQLKFCAICSIVYGTGYLDRCQGGYKGVVESLSKYWKRASYNKNGRLQYTKENKVIDEAGRLKYLHTFLDQLPDIRKKK